MRGNFTGALRKFSGEGRKMSADAVLDQMREFVIRAGGQRQHYDSKASWLARAARVLGMSHGRAAAYYYNKARSVSAQEWLAASAEIARLEAANEKRRETINELESMALAREAEREARRLADAPGQALRGAAGAASTPRVAAPETD